MTKLTRKVHEQSAKLKSLASSAMNGLKPDREDAEQRLLNITPGMSFGSPV